MIYVDPAIWKKPNGKKLYAHMVGDTLAELHAFALTIGAKPHFFHRCDTPHYDINSDQRHAAIAAGAQEIGSRELLKRSKEMT
jgi:Protein of unknown function (DUF4031)